MEARAAWCGAELKFFLKTKLRIRGVKGGKIRVLLLLSPLVRAELLIRI